MNSSPIYPDTYSPEIVAHYEIPRETYCRLRALALLMDRSEATRPYAAVMRSLFGQVVCVLED